MTERWIEFPSADIPLMVSNFGRICDKALYDEGKAKDNALSCPVSFQVIVKGVPMKVETYQFVKKHFDGFPCEYTFCHEVRCNKCGLNPKIAKKRKHNIEMYGLTDNGNGTKTYYINSETGI